jgi:PD-(D/E)XK nuclease superfamily protein
VFVWDTNRKGAIAESEIEAAAVRLGIPVLKPIAEHGRYDLGFEIGPRLLRVQCKWGGFDREAGVIKVQLQSSSCTPWGYVRSSYREEEIDLLAIYCNDLDRCYLLPSRLVADRRGIWLRLKPPKNGQRACINLASDFEFAGAVAQLGERQSGTLEATGSSPVSSTPSTTEPLRHTIGSNEFRNHFGYWLEQAAAGEDVLVTRRGKPFVRLSAA